MNPQQSSGKEGSSAFAQESGRDPYNPLARTGPTPSTQKVLPDRPASVGLSMSIGMATDFGREKVEVSAWCTVPCGLTQREQEEAYDYCAARVMAQLGDRMERLISEYHPHLLEKK